MTESAEGDPADGGTSRVNFGSVHLFVATPMYGGMCSGAYTASLCRLLTLCASTGLKLSYRFIFNESLITRARNDLVHSFLKTDCTHLLFVDADIRFQAEDVLRMVQADEAIVCGAYPKKEIDYSRITDALSAGRPLASLPRWASQLVFGVADDQPKDLDAGLTDKGLKEVVHAGTGFMMIRRDVFDKLAPIVPTYINNSLHDGESTRDFFALSICPDTHVMLSEDYHFCRLWRNDGGRIHVAPWVVLQHIGTHIYG